MPTSLNTNSDNGSLHHGFDVSRSGRFDPSPAATQVHTFAASLRLPSAVLPGRRPRVGLQVDF